MSKIKCGSRSVGKNEDDFDPYWLNVGEKIEYEHTCDKKTARRIAMDHLAEFSDYYKELQKMETRLEQKSKKTTTTTHHKKTKKSNGNIIYTNITNEKTDDVERNIEELIKSTDRTKKKIKNNLKNNFKYNEV